MNLGKGDLPGNAKLMGVRDSGIIGQNQFRQAMRQTIQSILTDTYHKIDPDNLVHIELLREISRLDTTYTIQLSAHSRPIQRKEYQKIKNLQMYYSGKLYKYTTGKFYSLKAAKKELVIIRNLGYRGAYIRKLSEYYPIKLKTRH